MTATASPRSFRRRLRTVGLLALLAGGSLMAADASTYLFRTAIPGSVVPNCATATQFTKTFTTPGTYTFSIPVCYAQASVTAVGAGGGGLSALCVGNSCSTSSVLVEAAGGGGAGYEGGGGAASYSASLADVAGTGQAGGPGYGGYGNDMENYVGSPGTPFGPGGAGNDTAGFRPLQHREGRPLP